jgi:preprotein translocase subunit SecE
MASTSGPGPVLGRRQIRPTLHRTLNGGTDQVSTVTSKPSKPPTNRRRGGLGLFIRQVVAELRKVVRPTRPELLTYTTAVLIFVLAVMIYVSIMDYGFGRLVLWGFGGK